jgi:negative regulator of replication initiation
MSRCVGQVPVGTKVDEPMRQFIDDETERLGVSNAEYLRRLCELARESRAGETTCEHCGNHVAVSEALEGL